MIPTISLGENDAPEFEVLSSEINPIFAVMVELFSPLEEDERSSVLSFLSLDTLFLDKETNGLFQKIESACEKIVSGEVVGYDGNRFQSSEFGIYARPETVTGVIDEKIVQTAKRYLLFLASNPSYWPFKE